MKIILIIIMKIILIFIMKIILIIISTSFQICIFLVQRYNVFKKFPKYKKKRSPKVHHNPTRPPVFSSVSFCFVKLRQFYSLKFFHL